MKILHVVAGLARSGGGLSELVPALAREAAKHGHSVTLATVANEDEPLAYAVEAALSAGVKLVRYAPAFPRRLFFSFALLRDLNRLVEASDVVHVHSNWTFPVWWACHLALRREKVLVMSPHGCVEPQRLRRSAYKKRIAGGLFDRRYLRRAAVVHATSAQEADSINDYVSAQSRALVVPLGVDLDAFQGAPDRKGVESRWPECKGKRLLLFLSRIHPLKGLDLLLRAWSSVADDFKDWQLLVAGPDESGYEARLKKDARAMGLSDRVTFCGPLYGKDRAMVLRSAALFVLPSRNENFGIVVAEALACGAPVITTKATPWQELLGCWASAAEVEAPERIPPKELHPLSTDNGRCGWWIDVGEEPLVGALKEALALSGEQLRTMGAIGRKLIEVRYQWPAVASRMERVYETCVNASVKGTACGQ